jgi:hypothetical protein
VQRRDLVCRYPDCDVRWLERGARVDGHERLAQSLTRPNRRVSGRGGRPAESEGRA